MTQKTAIKRFYKEVSPVATEAGFEVHLDGRAVKTPSRNVLNVPTQTLAQHLAEEWDAQTDEIDQMAMPLTRLAYSAVDRGEEARSELVDEICAYAESDLLCYRAEAPEGLAAEQMQSWQPLLDWVAAENDLRFETTSGIVAITQPQPVLDGFRAVVSAKTTTQLIGLQAATSLLGSAILSLAMNEAHITGEVAFSLSQLDELYQEKQWGGDEEATARRALLLADLLALERFLRAL